MKIKTLGIIGGGQLGRMICFYANMIGIRTIVFADQKDSSASFVTNQTIIADYNDKKALKEFCEKVDLATFEFENIPLATAEFVAKNTKLFPKPEVLEITQNRILEKNFLNKIGVKTAEYKAISSFQDLETTLKKFKKSILKTAMMGYDGKGQFVLSCEEDSKKAWTKVKNQQLILEKFCPFDSEISVIVARSINGETVAYEPLTNIHKNGILDKSIYPAKISTKLKNDARKLAIKIAREIDLIGIMAVEFFVCGENLLVNELAPRPHNSGHFSMNACKTSQFEQLIRAIVGMKLGATDFLCKGYMKNLIGDEVKKISKYEKNPRAKIHIYGKEEVKDGRKMGHVNVLE